jgi:redox-sensitive bicupin YhaK (pirin superfamily)
MDNLNSNQYQNRLTMILRRKITRIHVPEEGIGFLGPGHTASHLVTGDYTDTDPFIALMDDKLDKQDFAPSGGPHPHGGFETVSLLIDGTISEMLETMKKGDFQIMTAGSGIVHTETIDKPTKGRLFQLWLNLPKKERWTMPRLQILPAESVPVSEEDGVSVRLYSGSLDNLVSPVLNHTPLIVAEISMIPLLATIVKIPTDFRTFLVVVDGSVSIGENGTPLEKNQVGWLDLVNNETDSDLILQTGDQAVRLVMYAAKPLGDSIVSHGPFIADREEDIKRLYSEFRSGQMVHIADTPDDQRITY